MYGTGVPESEGTFAFACEAESVFRCHAEYIDGAAHKQMLRNGTKPDRGAHKQMLRNGTKPDGGAHKQMLRDGTEADVRTYV
jgi:hypothetical protein